MMEPAPAASLVVPKAQFLFQFLVIALDPPAQFGQINQAIEGHVRREGGQPIVASQYLAGSASPSGHSISSHSSSRGSARPSSRWAARTRTRAKREVSAPALPSRQETVCQLAGGKPSASALTLTGWCAASRRISFGRRPRPDQGSGGSGAVPGGHTEVWGGIPAT